MAAKKKLTPPDLAQCQAEITTTLGFMRCGGPPKTTERCKNKASMLAQEEQPGTDGLHGSMSVCDECLVEMKKQKPTGIRYTPIEVEKT